MVATAATASAEALAGATGASGAAARAALAIEDPVGPEATTDPAIAVSATPPRKTASATAHRAAPAGSKGAATAIAEISLDLVVGMNRVTAVAHMMTGRAAAEEEAIAIATNEELATT